MAKFFNVDGYIVDVSTVAWVYTAISKLRGLCGGTVLGIEHKTYLDFARKRYIILD